MEEQLTNQELHEFAQWYVFHYGSFGKEKLFPRLDVFELVDDFIKNREKNNSTNKGFVKLVAKKMNIYKDFNYKYLHYEPTEFIVTHNEIDWINQHFKGISVTNGLINQYYKAKISGNLFKLMILIEFKKEVGLNCIDENGNIL
ncbi:MAG: hypothetical protein ACOC33_04165 [bacterium]